MMSLFDLLIPVAGGIVGTIIFLLFRWGDDRKVPWGDTLLVASGFIFTSVLFCYLVAGWLEGYHL